MSINEKLSMIQTKLKVPKGQYNSYGGFHYRSCEDILEGVKPLLEETKTALTIWDEIINIGDRYYIKATAALHDQEGEGIIKTHAYAREPDSKKGMDSSQVTGTASSYARKYALNGLFCIDDTRDPDFMDNSQEEPKPKKSRAKKAAEKKAEPKPAAGEPARPAAVTTDQVNYLRDLMLRKGCPLDPVLNRYKVKTLAALVQEQYQNAVNSLEKMPDMMPAV